MMSALSALGLARIVDRLATAKLQSRTKVIPTDFFVADRNYQPASRQHVHHSQPQKATFGRNRRQHCSQISARSFSGYA